VIHPHATILHRYASGVGQWLLVDDYGYWRGARRATDDCLESLTRGPLLQRIDYMGRLCVKP
jgi:hypothetical protein